jgi:predicted glutamine amidotransferase
LCGLVGIAGKLEHKDEKTLQRMLLFDYFRGPDSTGLASIKKNGDVKIAKLPSHPIDLFDSTKYKEASSGYTSQCLIGHNRSATRGKVNSSNAHPFQYDHIVGAHNGTLDRASWTRLEDAAGERTEVDSQAIFLAISKIGIEETVKLMEEGKTPTEGAWALTWVNLQENTLNFLKNKHRPLWYAYTKEFDRVMWSSEYWIMKEAIAPATPKYELHTDNEGHGYWGVQDNWLYRFDLSKLDGKSGRPKPRVIELKGREPVQYQNVSNFPKKQTNGQTTTSMNGTSTYTGPSTGGRSNDLINLKGSPSDPFAGFLDKEDFMMVSRHGCSWCQEQIEYSKPGILIYDDDAQILCPDCSGLTGNRVYMKSVPNINLDSLVG